MKKVLSISTIQMYGEDSIFLNMLRSYFRESRLKDKAESKVKPPFKKKINID